jgi:hypothetical protein
VTARGGAAPGGTATGQGLVEYGLITALTCLFTLAALTVGGDLVAAFLAAVADAIGASS